MFSPHTYLILTIIAFENIFVTRIENRNVVLIYILHSNMMVCMGVGNLDRKRLVNGVVMVYGLGSTRIVMIIKEGSKNISGSNGIDVIG
jgi:hypothetical protein